MHYICGYSRVSSREQSENSHSLEQQQARLITAGAIEVFSDIESGKKDERKNFQKMMDLVRLGKVQEVIVTRLDRLTRSLPTLRKTVDELTRYGVNLRALDESMDFSTAAGKFHLNMLGALAEMEVDRLSERVRHGWQHLRDRSIAINAPFGYRKVENKHELDHRPFLCLLVDRSERSKAMIAREIIDAFLEKQTLRMCLRSINEKYGIECFANGRGRTVRDLFRFSPAGLRDWLLNPVLQGHLCYLRKKDKRRQPSGAWDIRYDTHPDHRLLLSNEVHQIEQILLRNKRLKRWSSDPKYPLSGLVYCSECRSACYSTKGSRGKQPGYNYYFQCKNWRVRSCKNKQMVRMETVEAAVIDDLILRAANIANIAQTIEDAQDPPELQQLKSQLAGLEALGKNSAIDEAIAKVRTQIGEFSHNHVQQVEVDGVNREMLLRVTGDRLFWKTMPDEDKRSCFQHLVKRVVIRGGQVEKVELRV